MKNNEEVNNQDEACIGCPSCNSTGIKVDFDRRDVSVCSLCKGKKEVTLSTFELYHSYRTPVKKENLDINLYRKVN